MSRVSRLCGALLIESDGQYWLVGNLKEPCDFAAVGFQDPGPIDPEQNPYILLQGTLNTENVGTCLLFESRSEDLAKLLDERLVIRRNHSVSERLWNLVTNNAAGEVDAVWLEKTPIHVWEFVRESILRCV